jgi:hypothetical protein
MSCDVFIFLFSCKVWAIDGSGYSQHKLVRTLTGHAHRINSLALNCDFVLRTGANQLGEKAIQSKNASNSNSSNIKKSVKIKSLKAQTRDKLKALTSSSSSNSSSDLNLKEEAMKIDTVTEETSKTIDNNEDDEEYLKSIQDVALTRYQSIVGVGTATDSM